MYPHPSPQAVRAGSSPQQEESRIQPTVGAGSTAEQRGAFAAVAGLLAVELGSSPAI